MRNAPEETVYTEVRSERTVNNDGTYTYFADVTDLMEGHNGGVVWVANVKSRTENQSGADGGVKAGWSLIVIYQPPNCPPRTIRFWDNNNGNNPAGNDTDINLVFGTGEVPASGKSVSYLGFMGLDGEDSYGLLTYNARQAADITATTRNTASANRVVFNGGNGNMIIQPFIDDQPARYTCSDGGTPCADAYAGFISSQTSVYDKNNGLNGNQVRRWPNHVNTLGYDAHHVKLPNNAFRAGQTTATVSLPDEQNGNYSLMMAYVAIEVVQPLLVAEKTSNIGPEGVLLNGEVEYTIKVTNKGLADSNTGPNNFITDTLDIPLDFVGNIVVKRGTNTLATYNLTNPQVIGHNSNLEYFKIPLPMIAAADAQTGTPTDEITITFSARVREWDGNEDIWRTGCNRTLQNKATLYYQDDEGTNMVGETNSEFGCGNSSQFASVYVNDTFLDDQIAATHNFEVNLANEPGVTDVSNEEIIEWVHNTMVKETNGFSVGQLTLPEAQGYIVTDMDGNTVLNGETFDPAMPSQMYMATKDISTEGYECFESFVVTFNVLKIPDMVVTPTNPLCPEGNTGSFNINLTGGGSGFAVRIVEQSAPDDVLYLSRTKAGEAADIYNAAYFAPGTYDILLEVQGEVIEGPNKTLRGVVLTAPSNSSTLVSAGTSVMAVDAENGNVCPETTFTLNQTKTNGASYTTYCWKQSVDGGVTWTDAVGTVNATNGSLTVTGGITGNTMYKAFANNTQCQITDEYTVNVLEVPVIANITADPICSGETFTVDPVALGRVGDIIPAGTQYTWTVAAVQTNASAQPTKQNTISQTLTNTSSPSADQTVIYTVTPWIGDCKGEIFTVSVTVRAIPTVATIPAQTICPDDTTTEVALATVPAVGAGIASFEWTIGGYTNGVTGGTAGNGLAIPSEQFTGSTPDVTLGGVAVYTITPTLNGCEGTDGTFTVNVKPTPTTNAVTAQTICSGESFVAVPLVSTPAGADFTWTVMQTDVTGASDNATPAKTIPATALTLSPGVTVQGNVIYTLTPTLASCVGTTGTFTVNVNPIPEAPTSTGYESCPTLASDPTTWLSLVNGIDPAATVKWYAAASGGAAIATPANFDKAVELTQSYWVTQTIDGCESTPRTEVKVNISLLSFAPPVSDYNECAVALTAGVTTKAWADQLTLQPTDVIHEWYADNSGSAAATPLAGEPAAFSLTTPGVYKYWVTILRNDCKSEPGLITVTIKQRPTAVLSTTDAILCDGETATLSIAFTGTAPFNYEYTDGTTSSGMKTATGNPETIAGLEPADGTTYSLVSLSDALCAAIPAEDLSGEPEFTVYEEFTPGEIESTGQTVCINPVTTINPIGSTTPASGGDETLTYEWRKNGTPIASSNSATYTPPATDIVNTGNAPVIITYTRWAKDATCNTAFEQSTGEWVITINPTPTVNTITDQELCADVATAAITFTGNMTTGVSYNWTNTNEDIGLAASGTGDIAAFTATNTTAAPISGVIRVTPTAEGCVGNYKEFTITVKPIPSVDIPADQIFCADKTTAAITLTRANEVTGTTYNWTNNNTAIGLAASGSNIIPVFTTVNAGTANAVATIEVTPVADGCTGTAETFTITVYPAFNEGTIASAGETICEGQTITEIGSDADASGGNGTIEYQWIKDGDTANPIANDAATYKPTEEGTYTRQVRQTGADACQTAWVTSGGSWKLVIRSGVDTGEILAGTATVCHNSTAPVLTVGNTTAASGGDGDITYEWRKSVAGAAAMPIAGSDSEDYIIPAADRINTGTANLEIVYTRWAKDGSCDGFAQSTGEFTLTVYPVFGAGAIETDGQVLCDGETIDEIGSATPASGGDQAITYRWFKDAEITPIAGATGETYIPVITSGAGTYVYRREAKDGSCEDWTESTGTWTVRIKPVPEMNTPLTQAVVCAGEQNEAVALSADVTTTTFAWVTSTEHNVTGAPASGTGDIGVYTLTTDFAGTDQLYFDITPTADGCEGDPIKYTIDVRPCSDLVLKYTLNPNTICLGDETVLTLTVENRSITDATDVIVDIALPTELQYVSHTADGAFDALANWDIPMIASGATASLSITLKGLAAVNNGDILSYIVSANNNQVSNPGGYGSVTEADQKADTEFTVWELPTATMAGDPVICNGDATGDAAATDNKILVTFTGKAPFEFVYTDATNNFTVSNISTTTYTLVVSPTSTTAYKLVSAKDDNNCAAATVSGQSVVTVNNAPTVPNVTPPAAVCEGYVLSLTAPTPIEWNGNTTNPDPSCPVTGWETNASGTWEPFYPDTTPMDYSTYNGKQVRYWAINGCGKTNSNEVTQVTIKVNQNPVATIVTAANGQICADGKFDLEGLFEHGTVKWTSDGQGTIDNDDTDKPTYNAVAADAGNTVTLTMTVKSNATDIDGTTPKPCADASKTYELAVKPLPTVAVTTAVNQEICAEDAFAVEADVANGTIKWTSNGGGTFDDDTAANTTYNSVPADAGKTITLTATVTSGFTPSCGVVSDTYDLVVNALPEAEIQTAINGEICADGEFHLTATANNGTVKWSTSNGAGTFTDDTSANTTYKPVEADAGKLIVLTMTVSNTTTGCKTAVDNYALVVNPLPKVDITTTAGQAICAGETFALDADIAHGVAQRKYG